jgi:hypothetical protein
MLDSPCSYEVECMLTNSTQLYRTAGVDFDSVARAEKAPHVHLTFPPTHLNSPINSSWNFTSRSVHSVPGAKNVVLKCSVPSFCPNPLPATTHTPVASSMRKQ